MSAKYSSCSATLPPNSKTCGHNKLTAPRKRKKVTPIFRFISEHPLFPAKDLILSF